MLGTSNSTRIAVLFLALSNATFAGASDAEDQSPESKAIETAEMLIEAIESEYDCEVAIQSMGPLFDSDRVQTMLLVAPHGSECTEALSALNDRGRAHGIAFAVMQMLTPEQDLNTTPQKRNQDLIYQIDPNDGAK